MPSIKSLAWMAAVSAAVVIGLQRYQAKSA
jgi:negative regulator of sigma E activity